MAAAVVVEKREGMSGLGEKRQVKWREEVEEIMSLLSIMADGNG